MVFTWSVITCFISILSHVWSYSFRLLMHHLMLTKPFLAVTSLMLFPAFSLPQIMICAFSQAPRMLWLWFSHPVLLSSSYKESCPAFWLSHYLLLILSTTSPTPQLNYLCPSTAVESSVPFSPLQQHFTVLLITPLADCISQAHNQRRSNFCSYSFSAALIFWEPQKYWDTGILYFLMAAAVENAALL